jgi:hypothetical protein
MKGKLCICVLLVGFSLVSSIWTSISFAQDTWAGAFSFTVKSTSQEADNSGNEKFLTSNQTFEGTISLIADDNGLKRNGDCYLMFLSTDGTLICITDIAGISTESQKSKSEKVLLVGVGYFNTKVEGTSVTGGIAYVDLKATLKQDSSNNLLSIALSGKIGGGVNEANDNFVFNATLNNTSLTKQVGSLN